MAEENAVNILVVLEKTESGYSAYLPDLPGCISTGRSIDEIRRMIHEAVVFHLEGMRLQDLTVPVVFESDYKLIYKMDLSSLFEWFSGILTKSARGLSMTYKSDPNNSKQVRRSTV